MREREIAIYESSLFVSIYKSSLYESFKELSHANYTIASSKIERNFPGRKKFDLFPDF